MQPRQFYESTEIAQFYKLQLQNTIKYPGLFNQ